MRIDDRYSVRLVIVYTLSIMMRLVVTTKARVKEQKEGSFVGSLAAGS